MITFRGLLIAWTLAGGLWCVGRAAFAQESAAPAADGGYRHATAGQPPAPAVLTAGQAVVGPPRAPAADGEGATARPEPASSSPRANPRQGSTVAEAQTHLSAAVEQLPTVSGGDRLLAAQICWLESSWRHDDCAAIVHVLRGRARRAGMPFWQMAIRYSAIDANTERAVFAAQLPNGDAPAWNTRTNARWLRLRQLAADAFDGRVGTPCRGATHWGARNLPRDVRRAVDAVQAGRWRVVRCRVETANAYYAEVRR